MAEFFDSLFTTSLSPATWAQIVLAVAAVVGIPTVIYELIQVAKGLRSTARASVYDYSARVKEALIANPDLMPYFDGEKEITAEDPNYLRVMAIADLNAVYLELIATQAEGISKANREAWSLYVWRVYAESPAIRAQIDRRKREFSYEFWKMLEEGKNLSARSDANAKVEVPVDLDNSKG